uniref:Uncharacterized protein n=1 Tax=Neobodo designis TaxID=312471 RepID=A0A7S1QYM5_NEODS
MASASPVAGGDSTEASPRDAGPGRPSMPQWVPLPPGAPAPDAPSPTASPRVARTSPQQSNRSVRALSPSLVAAAGDDEDEELASSAARSALKSDVRAFMTAQLRYARHGVSKSSCGVQCDRLLGGSTVANAFCVLADSFREGFENFGDLRDWADAVNNASTLARAGAKSTPLQLLADLCMALRDFLELRGGYAAGDEAHAMGDDEGNVGDGLRESERAERSRLREQRALAAGKPVFSSAKQQIVKQAEKIAALEDELRRTKIRQIQKTTQMEASHRETVRFETHRAVEQAKAAMDFAGNDDTRQLKFEIAALTNRVATRDQEIATLKATIDDLEKAHATRELEIANLEVALLRVEAEKEHHREDLMRESVTSAAKTDSEVAMLNSRIANFAETVMAYATQIRDMEVKHNAQLRRQKDMHDAAAAELSAMLSSARETLASRDAELTELRREYAKLSHRKAARFASVAKSHAAFADLTLAATSRSSLPAPKPRSVAEIDADIGSKESASSAGGGSGPSTPPPHGDGAGGNGAMAELPFTPTKPAAAKTTPGSSTTLRRPPTADAKSPAMVRQSALAARRASAISSVQQTRTALDRSALGRSSVRFAPST